jgi:hypothetical protein
MSELDNNSHSRYHEKMKWSPHAIIAVCTICLTLFGMAGAGIGIYVTSSVRIAEAELRLTTLEHAQDKASHDAQDYQTEMRGKLQSALDLLGQLRIDFLKSQIPQPKGKPS